MPKPASPPRIFAPRVLGRLAAIFFPAALVTVAVVLTLYYQDLTNEQGLYEEAGTHRVDLYADVVHREVKSVESDLHYLANQTLLRGFQSGHNEDRQALEEEYVLFCRQRRIYDQIRYLDSAGRERIRVNYNDGQPAAVPEQRLQAKADRYAFEQTIHLKTGEVFVSPFDLSMERGEIEKPLKPMIRFATPVPDPAKQSNAGRGVLILNYLGQALLNKLDQLSASYPGSVWLLNRDGYFLRGPLPTDEWGFIVGNERRFDSYFPQEWRSISVSSRGHFRTANGLFIYRGPSPLDEYVSALHSDPATTARLSRIAGEGGLLIVAHVPPDVMASRVTLSLMRLLLLASVVLVLVFVLAWYAAYTWAVRSDHERHLADSEARLRAMNSRLLTAQEDERRSVSRDLHDEMGQVITSMILDLERAAQAGDRAREDGLISRALHGANCLLERMHEISTRLRPTLLDDLGLRDGLRDLLNDYERRTGITVRAELQLGNTSFPPAVSENVYRIVQEALTNVAKHAHSPEVHVRVGAKDASVDISVRDQGIGLNPALLNGDRLGILGMRERAELLGGTFALEARPGQGTQIHVVIPFQRVQT
jgi:signal transduction histidine kinase